MEHKVRKVLSLNMTLNDREMKALAACLQHVNFDQSELMKERREELKLFAENFRKVLIEATD